MSTFPSKNIGINDFDFEFESYKIQEKSHLINRYMWGNPGFTKEDVENFSKNIDMSQIRRNYEIMMEERKRLKEIEDKKIRIALAILRRHDKRNPIEIQARWNARKEKRKLQSIIIVEETPKEQFKKRRL